MDALALSGKRIVVTRAEEQSGAITSGLEKLGANVIGLPTIKIGPAELSPDDVRRVSSIGNYDAVIFTSVNAVRHLLSHVAFKKESAGRPIVVAVGRTTAESLSEV